MRRLSIREAPTLSGSTGSHSAGSVKMSGYKATTQ